MPANQLFADWVTGDLITASKLNQMKNDLAALRGATFTGVLAVAPNVGQVLSLKGGSADHVYLGLYARAAAQNARSGYIGYAVVGTSDLNIQNEIPGGRVLVQGSEVPIERGEINFNSDWNSYTAPGYYRVVGGGSSAANTPPASYLWGVLLVIKAGTALTQLYTQHIGPGTFVRQAWNGNDWRPWVDLSPRFIGCRVRRTTDVVINVPSGTTSVTINWDAEDFDPRGMHDNAVNPSRIVIPQTGTYLISALLRWDAFGNSFNRYATLLRNGGVEETVSEIYGPGGLDTGSIVKQCNANDYLELRVSVSFSDSSGTAKLVGGLNTYLMVTYLGS